VRALEHEHRLATREREALAEDETKMRQREEALRQREETFKRRLTEELDTQVRQARREIDDVIADLKEKTATIAQEAAKDRVTTGDTGTARSDARASVESVARRFLEPVVPTEPEPQAPAGPIPSVGDRVIVAGLGLEAVVTAVHDGSAELDVRGKRMRATSENSGWSQPRRPHHPAPTCTSSSIAAAMQRRLRSISMSLAAPSTKRWRGRSDSWMNRSCPINAWSGSSMATAQDS
jgi:dsDNA-specific endonuclease/ATPase MutS2